VLTRSAFNTGIIQMVPTLASCSLQEMTAARQGNQVQWFQLYVNKNRGSTEALVKHAEALGCKALCVTVDAPALGKREKDMALKYRAEFPDAFSNSTEPAAQSNRLVLSQKNLHLVNQLTDSNLNFIEDLKELLGQYPHLLIPV
jgi:L-lactate dehydrogenase (cytochrome)